MPFFIQVLSIVRVSSSLKTFISNRVLPVDLKGSTLKELTLRWQPVRYTKRPHKQMMHRARDDIQESINELNHYRQQ